MKRLYVGTSAVGCWLTGRRLVPSLFLQSSRAMLILVYILFRVLIASSLKTKCQNPLLRKKCYIHADHYLVRFNCTLSQLELYDTMYVWLGIVLFVLHSYWACVNWSNSEHDILCGHILYPSILTNIVSFPIDNFFCSYAGECYKMWIARTATSPFVFERCL